MSMNTRETKMLSNIRQVKLVILEAMKQERKLDFKKSVLEIRSKLMVSDRKAKEYINFYERVDKSIKEFIIKEIG